MTSVFTRATLAAAAAALALTGFATPALAQRDPAYEAARKAGQIGEKPDGYLGVVGSQPAAVQKIAADINIKRRQNYAGRAQAANATLEEYAITQGCILISRTVPGEKYMTPQGAWETRTAAAPVRDSRCS